MYKIKVTNRYKQGLRKAYKRRIQFGITRKSY